MKVNVILGSACNLKCKHCFSHLPFDNSKVDIQKFCESLHAIIGVPDSISYGGGEPLLYFSYIKKIQEFFKCKSIITTNGTLINNEFIEWANSNPVYTVVSLYNEQLDVESKLINQSYSYTITKDRFSIPLTKRFIHFAPQHNVHGIPFIDKTDIDWLFNLAKSDAYVKEKLEEYYTFELHRMKDEPACFNSSTLSIDLRLNRYLCFRRFNTCIGKINEEFYFPHPYFSRCNDCIVKHMCRGGCIISETPEIECYFYKRLNHELGI